MNENRPFIVCLCGSTRFKTEYEKINREETLKGHIVLSVGCFKDDVITPEQKRSLDNLHLRKIDLADQIIIININNYIGESTQREINYAQRKKKPIKYIK